MLNKNCFVTILKIRSSIVVFFISRDPTGRSETTFGEQFGGPGGPEDLMKLGKGTLGRPGPVLGVPFELIHIVHQRKRGFEPT